MPKCSRRRKVSNGRQDASIGFPGQIVGRLCRHNVILVNMTFHLIVTYHGKAFWELAADKSDPSRMRAYGSMKGRAWRPGIILGFHCPLTKNFFYERLSVAFSFFGSLLIVSSSQAALANLPLRRGHPGTNRALLETAGQGKLLVLIHSDLQIDHIALCANGHASGLIFADRAPGESIVRLGTELPLFREFPNIYHHLFSIRKRYPNNSGTKVDFGRDPWGEIAQLVLGRIVRQTGDPGAEGDKIR